MSGTTDIEPTVLTPDDPELRRACQRPSNQQSCRNIPSLHNVDLGKRLQTLLDVLTNISMASLIHDCGILKTRLYIVFNHQNDDAARLCRNHLETIFQMLRQVAYTPTNRGSQKLIPNTLRKDFFEICRVIHNYSFSIIANTSFRRFRGVLNRMERPSHPTNVPRYSRTLSM